MAGLLRCNHQSYAFNSSDELISLLSQIESAAHSAGLFKVSIQGDCELLLDEALITFLSSVIRRVAFQFELPNQKSLLSYLYYVQLFRLNENRLFVLSSGLASRQFRAAKLNWLNHSLGLSQNLRIQNQHHQQQQQQEILVQSRNQEATTKLKRTFIKETRPIFLPTIGPVVTTDTLQAHFGEYWSQSKASTIMSLEDFWKQLVGWNIAYAERYETSQFKEPLLQAVQTSAMQYIIDNYSYFIGGLVAHNVPNGFFWAKCPTEGTWVLCLDFQLSKTHVGDAITVRIRPRAKEDFSPSAEEVGKLFSSLQYPGYFARKKNLFQDKIRAKSIENHETLFSVKTSLEQKIKALLFFVRALLVEKKCNYASNYHQQLKELLELISPANLKVQIIEGFAKVLLSHGLPGFLILLSRFLRFADPIQLSVFITVYLKSAEDYTALLEDHSLQALDELLELDKDSARLWWSLLPAQASDLFKDTSNLEEDFRAYRHFLNQVQTLFSPRQIVWPVFNIAQKPSSIKILLDRLLFILKAAACPKEQLEKLNKMTDLDLWEFYYASQQNGFTHLNSFMHLHADKLDTNNSYRIDNLASYIDSPHFFQAFAQSFGGLEWRMNRWLDYQKAYLQLVDEAKTIPLTTVNMNVLMCILFRCSSGKRASQELPGLSEKTVFDLLKLVKRLSKLHGLDANQFCQLLVEILVPLEKRALEDELILPDFVEALLQISACIKPGDQQITQWKGALALLAITGRGCITLFNNLKKRQSWESEHPTKPAFSWDNWLNGIKALQNTAQFNQEEQETQLQLMQLLALSEIILDKPYYEELCESLSKIPLNIKSYLLGRLLQINFLASACLWNSQLFSNLIPFFKKLSEYNPLLLTLVQAEELLHKKLLPLTSVVLLTPKTKQRHSLASLLQQTLKRELQLLKADQLEFIQTRSTLPTLVDVALRQTRAELSSGVSNKLLFLRPIYKALLKRFSRYETLILSMTEKFHSKMYDFEVLRQDAKQLDEEIRAAIKTILIPAAAATPVLFAASWKINSLFFNHLYPANYPGKKKYIYPLLTALKAWVLKLPNTSWLPWFEPVITDFLKLFKWLEEIDVSFSVTNLKTAKVLLSGIERSIKQLLNHRMNDQSLLGFLKEFASLLEGSKLQHSIRFLIQIIETDDLVSLLHPSIEELFALFAIIESGKFNEDELYIAIDRSEKACLALHKRLLDEFNLAEVLQESAAIADEISAMEEKEASSSEFIEERKQSKAIRDKLLAWFCQEQQSTVELWRAEICSRYSNTLTNDLDELNILPQDLAKRFNQQLLNHYLREMDNISKPLASFLRLYEDKFLRLNTLIQTLSALKDKFPEDFPELLTIFLDFYEQQGQVESLIQISKTLLRYPDNTLLEFAAALCQKIADKPKSAADNSLSRALQVTECSLQNPRSEEQSAEGSAFFLHLFEESLDHRTLFPKEQYTRLKNMAKLNQKDFSLLLDTLENSSSEQGFDAATIKKILDCIEQYVDSCPEILSALLLLVMKPILLEHWLTSFPSEGEEEKIWLQLVLALSSQNPLEEEWKTLVSTFNPRCADYLPIKRLFTQQPYPHKSRLFAWLKLDDANQKRVSIEAMEQHPVWAATDLLEHPNPPRLELNDVSRISPVIDKLLVLLEDRFISAKLKQTLAASLLVLFTFRKDYVLLSSANLQEQELAIRQEIQSEAAELVSQKRLQWLALLNIILYRSTGILANSTQNMIVLLSWYTKGSILFKAPTGQGKTFTGALLAVWEWLRTGAVHVTNPNRELIRQNFIEKGLVHFFARLGIPARMTSALDPNTNCHSGIIYSTAWDLSFIDSMGKISYSTTKPSPAISCIADECDSLLLHMFGVKFDFVNTAQDTNLIEWMYPLILDFINRTDFKNIDRRGPNAWDREKDVRELLKHIDNHSLTASQQESWRSLRQNYKQLSGWIDSACIAQSLVEGKHFLVVPNPKRQGFFSAFPIVRDVPQDAQYSHAVHCFLHWRLRKEQPSLCFDIPDEVSPVDSNYALGFAAKYQRLIGLSATLGRQEDQLYLMSQLGLSAFDIPLHEPSNLCILPLQFCPNPIEHWKAIIAQILRLSQDQPIRMPVLIIEEDANKVAALAIKLRTQSQLGYQIQTAIGDEAEQQLAKQIELAKQENIITICSPLFIRGLDLRPKESLLVIMACLREEDIVQQAFGRAGRYGMRGFARMIIDGSRYQLDGPQGIKPYQQNLSKESAVERYYTQSAAQIVAAAISAFDELAQLILDNAPAEQANLKQSLWRFRREWIASLDEIWTEGLRALDPDNLYANPYIRKLQSGDLELWPLDSLLEKYPAKIQPAWDSLIKSMREHFKQPLALLRTHASWHWKWLSSERTIVDKITKYLFESKIEPQKPAAMLSAQTWQWQPDHLAAEAEISLTRDEAERQEKRLALIGSSLQEIINFLRPVGIVSIGESHQQQLNSLMSSLNQKFLSCTLSQYRTLKPVALKLIALFEKFPLTDSPKTGLNTEESAKQVFELKLTAQDSTAFIASKAIQYFSWAKSWSWRYLFSRPSTRRAAGELFQAAKAYLLAPPDGKAAPNLQLRRVVQLHQKRLQATRIFSWNKYLLDFLHEAHKLFTEQNHDEIPETNLNIRYLPTENGIQYLRHRGFDSVQEKSTKKMPNTIADNSKQLFFKSWRTELSLEKSKLEQNKNSLLEKINASFNKQSYPLCDFPLAMHESIHKLNAINAAITSDRRSRLHMVGIAHIDAAIKKYNVLLIAEISDTYKDDSPLASLKEKCQHLSLIIKNEAINISRIETEVAKARATATGHTEKKNGFNLVLSLKIQKLNRDIDKKEAEKLACLKKIDQAKTDFENLIPTFESIKNTLIDIERNAVLKMLQEEKPRLIDTCRKQAEKEFRALEQKIAELEKEEKPLAAIEDEYSDLQPEKELGG